MKTRSQSSNQRLHLKTIILRKNLREALALRDLESAKDILLEIYKFINPNSNPDLIESSNTSIQVLNLAVVIGDLKLVDYIFTNNLISNHTSQEEFITKYSKVLPKNLFENILKLFDTKTTSEKQDIVLFCQETVDYDNDVEMVPVGDQDLGE